MSSNLDDYASEDSRAWYRAQNSHRELERQGYSRNKHGTYSNGKALNPTYYIDQNGNKRTDDLW